MAAATQSLGYLKNGISNPDPKRKRIELVNKCDVTLAYPDKSLPLNEVSLQQNEKGKSYPSEEVVNIETGVCIENAFGDCLGIENISFENVCKRIRERENKNYKIQKIVLGYDSENIDKNVALVYTEEVSSTFISEPVCGFEVRLQNPLITDNEARKVMCSPVFKENHISDSDLKIIKLIIEKHGHDLFTKHSNLNIISACSVKSKQRGNDLKPSPCIVLYCSSKGAIPLGENRFPTELSVEGNVISVDVREGFFNFFPGQPGMSPSHFNDPLRLGGSFSEKGNNVRGTIGPFVNLGGNNIGFITCAHIFYSPSQTVRAKQPIEELYSIPDVIQPASNSWDADKESICGYLKRYVFNPSLPTGVDAALVQITHRTPERALFATTARDQFRKAGFNGDVDFDTGSILQDFEPSLHKKIVIKFGSTTGMTEGAFAFDGTQVRTTSIKFELPNDSQVPNDQVFYTMDNQYEINQFGQDPFSASGDSGAGVFVKDNNNQLHCIGLVIGGTSYGSSIVTPIKAVLEALNLPQELKQF